MMVGGRVTSRKVVSGRKYRHQSPMSVIGLLKECCVLIVATPAENVRTGKDEGDSNAAAAMAPTDFTRSRPPCTKESTTAAPRPSPP